MLIWMDQISFIATNIKVIIVEDCDCDCFPMSKSTIIAKTTITTTRRL